MEKTEVLKDLDSLIEEVIDLATKLVKNKDDLEKLKNYYDPMFNTLRDECCGAVIDNKESFKNKDRNLLAPIVFKISVPESSEIFEDGVALCGDVLAKRYKEHVKSLFKYSTVEAPWLLLFADLEFKFRIRKCEKWTVDNFKNNAEKVKDKIKEAMKKLNIEEEYREI